MKSHGQVLLVSSRDHVSALVVAALEGHPVRVVATADADSLLITQVLGGMVVDIGSEAAAARRLVRAYLKHQPRGRVAMLTRADDITTLTAFAFGDGRTDLFFEPWDLALVRDFLGLRALART
jgi:DNA-binding NarL/FixJ family response regulator